VFSGHPYRHFSLCDTACVIHFALSLIALIRVAIITPVLAIFNSNSDETTTVITTASDQ
jgi:hypothetical protein